MLSWLPRVHCCEKYSLAFTEFTAASKNTVLTSKYSASIAAQMHSVTVIVNLDDRIVC